MMYSKKLSKIHAPED